MSEVEEVIREGKWRCPGCGNKNRGRNVKCGGCGQARENVEFEYDESAEEVTDAGELAVAEGGADWVCAYCSTSNRADAGKCGQCGGARDEGRAREVADVPPAGEETAQAFHGGDREETPGVPPALTKLGFGILALFVFLWWGCRTHEEKLKLANASWTRTIAIESYGPVVETDWDVPSGGRVLSSSREIHHYDKVPDGTRTVERHYTERVQRGTKRVKTGTKNMGNGYFKDTYENRPVYETVSRTRRETETVYRNVPVYRTKYRYEIHKWTKCRDVATSGLDTNPQWGAVQLTANEREGPRASTYEIRLAGGGKEFRYTPSEAQFTKMKLGEAYRVEVSGFGSVTKLLE
jgi:hypothetical protein